MTAEEQQVMIELLYKHYKAKGFIREGEALDLMSAHNASLAEIDALIDKLLSMGAIFADDSIEPDYENNIDKAQSDYEAIYSEAMCISPGLESLIQYIRNVRPPQTHEWKILSPQIKSGNIYAYNRFFDMYLRTVVRIALKYHKDGKIDLDDGIQEGTIGLMKAIQNFDQNKHENPATYTSFWIMQHIDRAIAVVGRSIRIPVHMLETIRNIQNITSGLIDDYDMEYINQVIADKMDTTVENVVLFRQYGQEIQSLDEVINQETGVTLGESIIDEELSIFELFSKKMLSEMMRSAINSLKPREQEVINLRFGFQDGKSYTLEEVGKYYGLTRERIRQIEAKAIRRLRHPSRSKELKDWSEYEGKQSVKKQQEMSETTSEVRRKTKAGRSQ